MLIRAPRRLEIDFERVFRMYLTKLLHFIFGRPTAEEEKLVKRVRESSTRVSDHGVGGYRVDSPITDWDEVEKQLDMAKKIVENEPSLNEKDRVFLDCLLVLMRSIDVKTRKVDELITKLEDMQ